MRNAFAVALHQLPPRERAVLVLHDILDWDLNDVAELLDIRLDTANCAALKARAAITRARSASALSSDDHHMRSTKPLR